MTFTAATEAAPPEAEFISYQDVAGWVIIRRHCDGTFSVCANMDGMAYMVFAAGVSAQRATLWSYDSRIFICGPLELMFRNMETEA
jgi:hypothetical protein